MVISVVSPHTEGNGNTTAALLLALGLGNMKKKVLLTHTDAISESLYMYLGLQEFEDKTSTPTQMVKLLREGAIQSEVIPDYCKNIYDSVYAFTNNKSNFTDIDMKTFSEYLIDHSDFDFIVYDVNDSTNDTAKYVISKSDVVVLNVTQSYIELDKFVKEAKKYAREYATSKVVLVCNKFVGIIGSDKDVVKRLGFKCPCNIIHYNPWLVMASNNGELLTLYKNIKNQNAKVAELNKDISRLATTITSLKIANLKTKQQEKKNLVQVGSDGNAE